MSQVHFAGTAALLRIFLNTTDKDTRRGKTWPPMHAAMYINFPQGKASKMSFSRSVENKYFEWWGYSETWCLAGQA